MHIDAWMRQRWKLIRLLWGSFVLCETIFTLTFREITWGRCRFSPISSSRILPIVFHFVTSFPCSVETLTAEAHILGIMTELSTSSSSFIARGILREGALVQGADKVWAVAWCSLSLWDYFIICSDKKIMALEGAFLIRILPFKTCRARPHQ
jgi:hypothetical protein